ncbi:MAG: hypothetical protein ABSH20_29385, partial [Tepidisphaeraceae bacterium]
AAGWHDRGLPAEAWALAGMQAGNAPWLVERPRRINGGSRLERRIDSLAGRGRGPWFFPGRVAANGLSP